MHATKVGLGTGSPALMSTSVLAMNSMIATLMPGVQIPKEASRATVTRAGKETGRPALTSTNVPKVNSTTVMKTRYVAILRAAGSANAKQGGLAMAKSAGHMLLLVPPPSLLRKHPRHRLRRCQANNHQSLNNSSRLKAVYLATVTSVLSVMRSVVLTARLLLLLSKQC